MPEAPPIPRRRQIALAVVGLCWGVGLWLTVVKLPEWVDAPRVALFAASWVAAFGAVALMSCGPLRTALAASYAAGLAALDAAAITWASLRFDTVGQFVQAGHPLVAGAVFTLLPVPFLIAHERAPKGYRDYAFLFDQSWSLFLRAVAAAMFAGLFWAVLWASDGVLSLVGIDLLGRLMAQDWFGWSFTGLAIGLAMGVLAEFEAMVATARRMVLRLLRLLAPVVAAVVTVFVLLLPVRGFAETFAGLSPYSVLIAMAATAIVLVTAAVDARDGAERPPARAISLAAQLLALALPVLAGAALAALWLRVAQYGLSPARLAGGLVGLIALIYGGLYAVAVLARRHWRRNIRLANTFVAVLIIVLSGLWLTPALNVEAIAASNQLKRIVSGRTPPAHVDIAAIAEWGRPGARAVAEIRRLAASGERPDLAEALARPAGPEVQLGAERLAERLVVRPSGPAGPLVRALPGGLAARISLACETGPAPGCVAVVGAEDALVIWHDAALGRLRAVRLARQGDAAWRYAGEVPVIGHADAPGQARAVLDALRAGATGLGQVTLFGLAAGGVVLPIRP